MIADLDTRKLNATKLKALRKSTSLDQRGFATLSNNSRETVIKFEKTGKVSAPAKRGIVEAVRLVQGLAEIMEPENIATWLKEPNPGLRNKSPIDIIQEGRVDIIWTIIEETRQGTFA
ncbi:antitoxin Xre/MbcA/ParS toxin-binding domain-containing protein [Pelagicoccus mobilis]|uniref:DUF2384 domain-containing protein n=1 Tax=Pelagicoccus mobilis TaxID=415221 RepID=A0A934VSL0_9BACT|nr:antitoxin Xre/MbcA/ParS toxin-binding domain-containing protein [Pelagicoccus mobilis]MBK1878783.1 DUF2384 domain-containing protein [Pelagicoccus mobilis]